jgi:hypothetical protein
VPCYQPWDSFLTRGTDAYAKARARVETMAAAMQHVVDAYLQMHGAEPPRGRVEIPF